MERVGGVSRGAGGGREVVDKGSCQTVKALITRSRGESFNYIRILYFAVLWKREGISEFR